MSYYIRVRNPWPTIILIIVFWAVFIIMMYMQFSNRVRKEYTERVRNEETTTSGKQDRLRQLRTTEKENEAVNDCRGGKTFNYMLEMWTCVPQSMQREKP